MPVEREIRGLEIVELIAAVGHWPAGTQGMVIGDYGEEKMLEMLADRDDPLDLPIVSTAGLKQVAKYSEEDLEAAISRRDSAELFIGFPGPREVRHSNGNR
jgi:hypothetical protein